MSRISSQQPGISGMELEAALPLSLEGKVVHLFWIDRAPQQDGSHKLTAKLEVNGHPVLLGTKIVDDRLLEEWEEDSPEHHTNTRLLALERILTDAGNEEILIAL